MREEDVDFLRGCLAAFPEFSQTIRLRPPAVFFRGRWRPIRSVAVRVSGIEIRCDPGRKIFIRAGRKQGFSREKQIRHILALLRKRFHPCRILGMYTATSRNQHQSGAFLRILLDSGKARLAVVAAYEHSPENCSGRLLTAAVLWWHQIRCRRKVDYLVLIIPETWSDRLLSVIRYLVLPVRCYKMRSREGDLRLIYPRRPGYSRLTSPFVVYPFVGAVPERLLQLQAKLPGLEVVYRRSSWELSYLGLPLIRAEGKVGAEVRPVFPLPWIPRQEKGFFRFLTEVKRFRVFPPLDARHPLYRFGEERWLESLLIRDLHLLHPNFSTSIYCQVPSWLEGDRKVLDVLTATQKGRLAVVEMKVTRDLSLVFQGLDYWDRVKHHLHQGAFEEAGYFPRLSLSQKPPLLYLVSPLFEFHRTLSVVRRYLRRNLIFECVGINSDWKKGIRLLRRFRIETTGEPSETSPQI